jgi:hypothetical protein
VIAFFRRSDLIDYYPNGVIGTEVDHGPPCTIVGPLSPLLEEDMHNNNTNTGGDEEKTLYENGGESPSNQVSSEDEGAITNIDSLRNFTMKRHLPTDIDDDNDSITTTDDYEHETLPAAYTLDASPTDDNEPPPLLRRSIRRKTPTTRYTYRANVAIQQNISEIPDDLQIYMHRAYQADIVNSLDTTLIDPLLPTPDHWRQILTYPTTTKSLWTKSFAKEFNELIKKGTVAHDTPVKNDPIIPVTVSTGSNLPPKDKSTNSGPALPYEVI